MSALRLPPHRASKTPFLRIRYSSGQRAHGSPRYSSSTASAPSLDLSTLRHLFTRLHPSYLWTRYNVLLRSHPLKTRMATSGTLFVIGDMISQHVIEQRPFGPGVWSDQAHAVDVETREREGHVWVRTARLAFYGVSFTLRGAIWAFRERLMRLSACDRQSSLRPCRIIGCVYSSASSFPQRRVPSWPKSHSTLASGAPLSSVSFVRPLLSPLVLPHRAEPDINRDIKRHSRG